MGFWLEKNGMKFYQFDLLAELPGLKHGVTTRAAGNLSFHQEEAEDLTRANLTRVEGALGLGPVAQARQSHGVRILTVKKADEYQPRRRAELSEDYDALVTAEAGVDLLVKLADCQGILLHEPKSGLLALVHSGWRGSVRNIIGQTVAALAALGADPADMWAGITPSLGPCCAEFRDYRTELPEAFQAYKDHRDHFDFWALSRDQLKAAGLRDERVEVAGICTKCSPDFFSYRGGDQVGRFGLLGGRR